MSAFEAPVAVIGAVIEHSYGSFKLDMGEATASACRRSLSCRKYLVKRAMEIFLDRETLPAILGTWAGSGFEAVVFDKYRQPSC